jgi:hypothetical protein
MELEELSRKLMDDEKAQTIRAYAIASKVAEIEKRELWKRRRNSDGTPVYPTMAAFCQDELQMTPEDACDILRIGSYTEEQIGLLGPAKLRVMMWLTPEADPLTSRPTRKRKRASAITVDEIEGEHTVRAHAKPATPVTPIGDCPHANNVEDVPWGYLDMANGVRMFISLTRAPDGALRFQVDVRSL